MPGWALHALASSWRAFFLAAGVTAVALQAGPPPNAPGNAPKAFPQFGRPDQAEGRRVLEIFRQSGIPGEYFLEFELRVLPRRGDERVIPGRLWGSRNEQGAVNRIAIDA